jgi:hypothetical protein
MKSPRLDEAAPHHGGDGGWKGLSLGIAPGEVADVPDRKSHRFRLCHGRASLVLFTAPFTERRTKSPRFQT